MENGGGELFAVDNWGCRRSKVFFLTHMHTDHTKGLSQRWRRGPIYCSAITAALLRLKFPALDVCILPLSTPTLIPLPYPHLLEVTAIDADHCPGSVMFVFRGAFGCILHTGDFRWESGSPKLDSMKHCIAAAVGGSRVNVIHLDNTFCNPRFSFPPRHVAAQQVVDIIAKHKGFDVLIGIDMLGKEELLAFIAKALETKIWVWPERLQTMKVLGITEFFIADTTATRIRAVPRYSISHKTLSMLNEIRPTIAVLPSGLNCLCKASVSGSAADGTHACYLGSVQAKSKPAGVDWHSLKALKTGGDVLVKEGKDCQRKESEEKSIFCVSYSLHSCFFELKEFLEFVKPLSVKGNLRSSHLNISPCQPLLQMRSNRENDSWHFATFGETSPAMSMLESDENMQGGHAVNDYKHLVGSSNNCTYEHEQYLHIVNRDVTFPEKDIYFGKKLRGRIGLKQALCKRSQRAWAVLRRKRGGGTLLCSET